MKACEAMIAWTPESGASPTAGRVEIGALLSTHDYSDWTEPYQKTGGAVFTETRGLKGTASLAMLFIEFHTLVVRDGIKPDVAHRAFLATDEYRDAIAPDIT